MTSAGVTPNTKGLRELKDKLARIAAIPADAPLADVPVDVYRTLTRAPSRVLLATLDDALGVLEQPNMPGTTTSWPNWSLPLPLPLEDIRNAELPRRIAGVMRR
jgi:4-alpha-glucanotransferase